jgi:copper transport protein
VRALALAFALFAALWGADAALAHASLLGSEPADRAMVAESPQVLRLTFNEPVSPLALRLVTADGGVLDLADVTAADAALTVRLPGPLPQGTHVLSWRVISADGHPVGGSIMFSVGRATEAPEVSASRAPRWPLWLAKLGLYLGLFVGVGGVFYAAWIGRAPLSNGARSFVAGALAVGLFAAAFSIGLQGTDAFGEPLSALWQTRVWLAGFATSYGLTASIALLSLAVAELAMNRQAWARPLSLLALIGAATGIAASGHAATAEPQWLMRPTVFLHVGCIAFWIGALVPLGAALRREAWPELARFSRAIPWPVAALIVSGAWLAVVQVRQIDALWDTAYGLVLSAKLVALVVLFALALQNRRLTPSVLQGNAGAARKLTLSIRAEIAVMAVILGLVACWRFTPPPRSLIAAAEAPVQFHIHTGKAMADIKAERRRDGARVFQITLLNDQFGPLEAKEVTLILRKPDAGIEPLRWPATHVEATIWRTDGIRLPLPGRWRAQVDILVSDFEKITIEDEIDLPR